MNTFIGCSIIIHVTTLKLFKVYVVKDSDNQHILIVFTGKIEGEPRLNEEIEAVQWIREEEIDAYSFYTESCRQKLIDFYKDNGWC